MINCEEAKPLMVATYHAILEACKRDNVHCFEARTLFKEYTRLCPEWSKMNSRVANGKENQLHNASQTRTARPN